jgi:hypothetical protein
MTTAAMPAVQAAAGGSAAAGAGALAAPAVAKKATKKAAAKKTAPAPRGGAGGGPRKTAAKKTAATRAPAAKGRPARPEVQKSRGRQRQERAQSFGKGVLHGGLGEGGAAHRVLVAEFVLCIVLIGLTPVLMRKPANGKLYVPNDFVRLSAVSLLFFVLSLASASPRSSRVAAAFGGLVTLGTLYNASGSIKAIGSIFSTAKSTAGAIPTALAGTATVDAPTYTPGDLSANPMGTPPPSPTGQVTGA